VINVVFDTVKSLSLISERTTRSKLIWENYLFQIIWGELYENYHYRTDFSFELRIRTRIPKAIMYYQPRGKRSLGRPMKRWHENPLLRS
jgi:hypothetical protein